MKPTLTVACIFLRSVWQAVCRRSCDRLRRLSPLRSGSLRSALTALRFASLGAFLLVPTGSSCLAGDIQVHRNFMPEAGPSAFGVAMGPDLALIYDPLRGGVNQAWRGTLDLAPTRRAKINEAAAVVGAVFYEETMVQPLRVGSAEAVPVRRFKGYRYEQGAVVFEFTLDEVRVRETLRARADGGVERMLSAPPGTVLFYLTETQNGSRLTITGAEEIRPGIWRHEAVEGSPLTLTIQTIEKP